MCDFKGPIFFERSKAGGLTFSFQKKVSECSRPQIFWCLTVISVLCLAVFVVLLFTVAPQGQHHAGAIHDHQKTSKGGCCSISACKLTVHPGETFAGIEPLSCFASVRGIDPQGYMEVNANTYAVAHCCQEAEGSLQEEPLPRQFAQTLGSLE